MLTCLLKKLRQKCQIRRTPMQVVPTLLLYCSYVFIIITPRCSSKMLSVRIFIVAILNIHVYRLQLSSRLTNQSVSFLWSWGWSTNQRHWIHGYLLHSSFLRWSPLNKVMGWWCREPGIFIALINLITNCNTISIKSEIIFIY